jgi:hypothetical protein
MIGDETSYSQPRAKKVSAPMSSTKWSARRFRSAIAASPSPEGALESLGAEPGRCGRFRNRVASERQLEVSDE